MHKNTRAIAISRVVRDMADKGVFYGHVMDSHQHACNLELTSIHYPDCGFPSLITLTDPSIGNGVLSIVLSDMAEVRSVMLPDPGVTLDKHKLKIQTLEIELDNARVWDPLPDWQRLRTDCDLGGRHLDEVLVTARRLAPAGSLLNVIPPEASVSHQIPVMTSQLYKNVAGILEEIGRNWHKEQACLQKGAHLLAGLGHGLTPSGDDFLIGMMLAIWLRHPAAQAVCRPLADSAGKKTTRLSATLLDQTAMGHCSAVWHGLFQALAHKEVNVLEKSIVELLACGHTSGADALAGFLWMARL